MWWWWRCCDDSADEWWWSLYLGDPLSSFFGSTRFLGPIPSFSLRAGDRMDVKELNIIIFTPNCCFKLYWTSETFICGSVSKRPLTVVKWRMTMYATIFHNITFKSPCMEFPFPTLSHTIECWGTRELVGQRLRFKSLFVPTRRTSSAAKLLKTTERWSSSWDLSISSFILLLQIY